MSDANSGTKRRPYHGTADPTFEIPNGLVGQLLWGKERSLAILEQLRDFCRSVGICDAANARDLDEMQRRIEANDFDPLGGAQDPYYRISGRLIAKKYSECQPGLEAKCEPGLETKRSGQAKRRAA
jgi:hypothetical protein